MQVSTSFVQGQAHESKSSKFVPIKPSDIGAALSESGFNLVHLRSGRARKEANAHHQTTIARYRRTSELTIGGLNYDVVFKVPHLTGSLQAYLGTYRQVCSNGLVVGHKFFEAPRIRHTGDALSQLETLIQVLVAKEAELTDMIQIMSARNVTPNQVAEFIREVAVQRVGSIVSGQDAGVVQIQYDDLARVRRQADNGTDAFSILNVVQENIMRHGIRYQLRSVDQNGQVSIRNQVARPLTRTRIGETESVRSVDMNASIWDAATKILLAA